MTDIVVYLDDILDCIAHIRKYLKGVSLTAFDEDDALQDAVTRRLEIIGEAVERIPVSVRKQYPSIPWKKITGMRDILVHEYAGVSVKTLWRTSAEDLDPLAAAIRRIKRSLTR